MIEAIAVDHYQERIDRGECAWCEDQATITVIFEECFEADGHATPVCAQHFAEYFEGIGWEWIFGSEWQAEYPECCC